MHFLTPVRVNIFYKVEHQATVGHKDGEQARLNSQATLEAGESSLPHRNIPSMLLGIPVILCVAALA